MKTYLLPKIGSFYKTNLHCHSTHINFISLEPDNIIQPLWHRKKYHRGGNAATYAQNVFFDEEGNGITRASFPIDLKFGYFRITVTDKKGLHACTNAYFPEDYLFEEKTV